MAQNDSQKNDLLFLWRVVKRFWLLMALLAVFFGATGYVLARWVITPTYQATALIFAWAEADGPRNNSHVSDAQQSSGNAELNYKLQQEQEVSRLRSYQMLYQQLNVGNMLMPDLQALLNSKKLRNMINQSLKEKLGDQFTPHYTLSAKPLTRTRFVEVSVRCHSKELAPTIINVAMEIFTLEAQNLLGINNTQVIDAAKEATYVAPRPMFYLLGGFILGGLLGFGIGFLIDFFDKSIRDLKELENRIKLPVLGVLPEVASGSGNDRELWQQDNKTVYGEAVRSLRVNVEYLLPESGHAKTFLVTSVDKGDGKSSIISSLAVAIARLEKKVLLIDMDLRRPRQHRVFQLPNQAGLVDLLVSKKSFEELVFRNVKQPGLDVLTSGTIPLSPSDLLASPRLEEFLKAQSQNYDYIFMDAPPMLGLADPMILGKLADSTIFACNFKTANIDKIRSVIERMRESGIHIGGLVINRFSLEGKGDYYYYYQHYYYGYHYSYTSESDITEEVAALPEDDAAAQDQTASKKKDQK